MTRKLKGWHVLAMLLAFFGSVMAVNTLFVVKAIETFRGEDEPHSYLQGLGYNKTLAERAAQSRLGWHATIAAIREGERGYRIVTVLTARDGTRLSPGALAGELRHPSDAERDRPLHFTHQMDGSYSAEIDRIAPGAWDVLIRTSAASVPFEASRRLWLR